MIHPMAAMALLTFVVLAAMFVARMSAMRSGELSPRYFKTYDEGRPPERALKAARHFTNLFEVPVLFYAACLAAAVMQADGEAMRALAWAFVVARAAHAYIHLGSNKLIPRAVAFAIGCAIVASMWALLALRSMGVLA